MAQGSGYAPACTHQGPGIRTVAQRNDPPVMDEQHVALPKLYGAPAYGRPSTVVVTTERPLDPDDLPISAFQTEEERALAASLPARAYAPGGGAYIEGAGGSSEEFDGPRARPLSLRAIAGRLLGG